MVLHQHQQRGLPKYHSARFLSKLINDKFFTDCINFSQDPSSSKNGMKRIRLNKSAGVAEKPREFLVHTGSYISYFYAHLSPTKFYKFHLDPLKYQVEIRY